MHKVIIDTDPGIDDAIAICYAMAHPKIEALALTTVFGNVHVQLAADNALRLCELNNAETAVATGAEKPLLIAPNPHSYFVHGDNGFGNIALPLTTTTVPESASELLVDLIMKNPGEITVIAVGPLTNLALALTQEPEIANHVKSVVVMGGAFYKEGNVTPHAEANVWNDPHAAHAVFTADWPVVVHGLDVTHQVSFDRNFFDDLAATNNKITTFLHDAAEFYIDFYEQQHQFTGCCPHDLLAFTYVTQPDFFKLQKADIAVVTDGEEIGRTIASAPGTNCNKFIASAVDTKRLKQDYAAVIGTSGNS